MNRLIENTVFSGFVIACRLATWPTRISPSFVNPTTEGVRRLPSWFAMTVGSPPSTTATTELVVPRSMPITFAMCRCLSSLESCSRRCEAGGGADHPRSSAGASLSRHVDPDLLGLDLLGLGKGDRQDA